MTDEQSLKHLSLPDFTWLLGQTLARHKAIRKDAEMAMEGNKMTRITDPVEMAPVTTQAYQVNSMSIYQNGLPTIL